MEEYASVKTVLSALLSGTQVNGEVAQDDAWDWM